MQIEPTLTQSHSDSESDGIRSTKWLLCPLRAAFSISIRRWPTGSTPRHPAGQRSRKDSKLSGSLTLRSRFSMDHCANKLLRFQHLRTSFMSLKSNIETAMRCPTFHCPASLPKFSHDIVPTNVDCMCARNSSLDIPDIFSKLADSVPSRRIILCARLANARIIFFPGSDLRFVYLLFALIFPLALALYRATISFPASVVLNFATDFLLAISPFSDFSYFWRAWTPFSVLLQLLLFKR